MSKNTHIITRSNYTLKEKHKSLKNGNVIYERDYMTTTNLGGWDSGAIPYGESNFKFVHNQKDNNKKSFNNGKWLTDKNGDTVWTLSDVSNTSKKKESTINIKPNKNNLKDYAYYGSCVELIKASLENIIKYFPAELYITNSSYVYTDSDGNNHTLGENAFSNPVVIYNPFNINITQNKIKNTSDSDYNPLRYFAESLDKYVIINQNETNCECFNKWVVKTKNKKCYKIGDLINNVTLGFGEKNSIIINEYFFPQGNILITEGIYDGYRIRPMEKFINQTFNEKFSSFDLFLLNRDSKPKYTISIDVPNETNEGISLIRTNFSFPVMYDWNPDVTSTRYDKYVNDLTSVAEAYDRYYSNNLWENIVHESIKNTDVTFSNPSKDENIDDYRIGIGNIHGIMLAYARQFDDIKLAIDNINSCNIVTYNENNNIPDYFLSDSLELSGWEVCSAVKSLDETVKVGGLFSGSDKEYTTEDVNTLFMRNLKLNSKAIFSRKGNRQGIEMLLSLFGLSSYEFGRNYYNCLPESSKLTNSGVKLEWDDLTDEQKSLFYDYKLNEYVVVAKNNEKDVVDVDEVLCVEDINQQIKGDNTISIVNGGNNEPIEIINPLVGLPARMVYVTQIGESGETTTLKYIIPWFDKTEEYDGKTYFQMYGGWEKIEDDSGSQYTETLKYLNIIDSLAELATIPQSKLNEGDIYYVTNIDDYKKYYPTHNTEQPSHYFYLKNVEKSYKYGDWYDDTDGWQIIPQIQVKDRVSHGAQVYQLENIINEYRGNNPHVGYGKYDDGDKYLYRISHLFDGTFDDNLFTECQYTCNGSGITKEEIQNIGFNLTEKLVDNVKCWYFVDNNNNNNKLLTLKRKYTTIVDGEGDVYEVVDGYEENKIGDKINVGKTAFDNKEIFLTSGLQAFNLETQENDSNDEAAANSVVNVKNISLEFNGIKYGNSKFNKYLHEVILPYLNQVIPSTSILTIKYNGNNEFDTCYSTAIITGVSH